MLDPTFGNILCHNFVLLSNQSMYYFLTFSKVPLLFLELLLYVHYWFLINILEGYPGLFYMASNARVISQNYVGTSEWEMDYTYRDSGPHITSFSHLPGTESMSFQRSDQNEEGNTEHKSDCKGSRKKTSASHTSELSYTSFIASYSWNNRSTCFNNCLWNSAELTRIGSANAKDVETCLTDVSHKNLDRTFPMFTLLLMQSHLAYELLATAQWGACDFHTLVLCNYRVWRTNARRNWQSILMWTIFKWPFSNWSSKYKILQYLS